MARHLYDHLVKELPFVRIKLTGTELNMLIGAMSKWLCEEGADPITLAKAVIRVMREEDKTVAEKATHEDGFLKELDKL